MNPSPDLCNRALDSDTPIVVDLPPMQSARDVANAVGAITAAVGRGELTPAEGASVAGLIGTYRRTLELIEMEVIETEERVADLERVMHGTAYSPGTPAVGGTGRLPLELRGGPPQAHDGRGARNGAGLRSDQDGVRWGDRGARPEAALSWVEKQTIFWFDALSPKEQTELAARFGDQRVGNGCGRPVTVSSDFGLLHSSGRTFPCCPDRHEEARRLWYSGALPSTPRCCFGNWSAWSHHASLPRENRSESGPTRYLATGIRMKPSTTPKTPSSPAVTTQATKPSATGVAWAAASARSWIQP